METWLKEYLGVEDSNVQEQVLSGIGVTTCEQEQVDISKMEKLYYWSPIRLAPDPDQSNIITVDHGDPRLFVTDKIGLCPFYTLYDSKIFKDITEKYKADIIPILPRKLDELSKDEDITIKLKSSDTKPRSGNFTLYVYEIDKSSVSNIVHNGKYKSEYLYMIPKQNGSVIMSAKPVKISHVHYSIKPEQLDFQESAFSDIRNGVNPKSKKLFFHISLDEEINESKVERVNDEGVEVPEKCDKCGSRVELYLKGEPVWLCSNKKCSKYFGTAPCNFQEATTSRYKDFGDNKTVKEQYDMDDIKYAIDLGSMMNTSSITDDVVQEGMFEAGFNNLRYKLVQALGDKYKITNIMKGMGGVANKFIVSLADDPNKKADVISVGSGVKIPGKFTNISLSQAFDKLMDFFSSPEFLTESFEDNIDTEYQLCMEASVSPETAAKNKKENLRLLKYNPLKRTIVIDGPDGKPMTVKVSLTALDMNATDIGTGFSMKNTIYVSSNKYGEPYMRIPPAFLEKDPSILMPLIDHEAEHIHQLNYQKQRTGDQVGHCTPRDNEAVIEYTREFIKKYGKHLTDHDKLEHELLADFHAALKHGRKTYMKSLRDIGEYGLSLKRLKTSIVDVLEDNNPQLKLFRNGDRSVKSNIKALETYIRKCEYIKKNCEKIVKLSNKQSETYEAVGPSGMKFETDIHSMYSMMLERIKITIELNKKAISLLNELKTDTIDADTEKSLKNMNLSLKMTTSKPVLVSTMINLIISTELRGKFIKQIMRDKPWLTDTNTQSVNESYIFDGFNDFDIDSEFFKEYGIDIDMFDEVITESKTDEDDKQDDAPTELKIGDNDDMDDLGNFGSDNDGSSPNNDYDEEEINTLNELIASESSAIGEYLDAAKKTNVDILRRLYSDIGDEERFHSEQLMFAKATLTGEKYEPRDPDVKREYQELLERGMDEETAMTTAIDKHGLRFDTEDDEDLKDLEKDMEVVESAIASYVNSSEMLDVICEHAESFTTDLLEYQYDVFVETFCMEAVDNVARRPFTDNPITLIVNGFKALIKLMQQLMRKIQQFVDRIRVSSKRRNQWIKTHGIASLFKSGISMYFYDDKNLSAMSTEPLRYAELMHNMTVAIAQNVGITHIKPFDGSTQGYRWETIRVNSVEEGCEIIKGVVLTKQKIVVTEQNKDMLAEIFFGYNDSKFSNGKSVNLYHIFELVMERIKTTCEFDVQLIEVLNNMSSNPNSVYYKDRQLYEQAVSSMKVVKRGFDVFIKAVAHDMNVIMKLNNGLLEQTQMKDNNANQQNVNNNNGVNGPIPMRFNN